MLSLMRYKTWALFVCGCAVVCFFCIEPLQNQTFAQDPDRSSLMNSDSSFTAGGTGTSASYQDIAVTRWIDPEGRVPITYQEWKATIDMPGYFASTLVGQSPRFRGIDTGTKFSIIVNSDIYDAIEFELDRYVIELTGEGFEVSTYTTSGGTPEDFRSFLYGLYAGGMEGCVLIGDLPVAWYETYDCWDGTPDHEQFPCDIFYMDLDGDFADGDLDDVYDSHTGAVEPDIWVGRLTAAPLNLDGANEISLLKNYFDKNHLYRSELRPLNSSALVYVDDDWANGAEWWDQNVGLAYATRTFVNDEETTWHDDYEDRLDDNYEFIQVCVHSSPSSHSFYKPSIGWGYTTNQEVKNIDPLGYFYNLFACSNARYVESNYMGGWYIFCQDYGLAAVGSAKTGSMLDFEDFYLSFGQDNTIGEAYRDWFTARAEYGFDHYEQCWFHGMTLLGDPTLRRQFVGAGAEVRITPVVLPDGEVGVYYNEQLTVTDGLPPYSWEVVAGDMPDGVSLDPSSGAITGTPTLAGTGHYIFTARVTDGDSPPQTDIQHLSINVEYCYDTDEDGFGDPGHPENTCPTDNCPYTYNPDQEDVDGDGIGDSCEVIRMWYVQADGLGDAPTIQAAIDSCSHGDTVLVADGVFTGPGNRDIDLRGRQILFYSENGPAYTIIDCQGSPAEPHRGFIFQNGEDETWVVEGFTVKNGYGPMFSGSSSGGGAVFDYSSPIMQNCIFIGNSAVVGGALYSFYADPQFINCTFVGNTSNYGAVVFAYNHSAVSMDRCIVAFSDLGEPAMCFEVSSVELTCSDVYGNVLGDWVGCMAGQGEINGNMSIDPFFCDSAAGDFHIADLSPCAPGNNGCAALIGALEVNCGAVCVDSDGDGYGDPGHPENWCADDNCPADYNPDQTDTDSDGAGDVCDDDDDGDGIPDSGDNCPLTYNPGQEDDDTDGVGDACDLCPGFDDTIDGDTDGIPDDCDNCPLAANADQTDTDGDGDGNACDPDDDDDGVLDESDNCPLVANVGQEDNDGDGAGDFCDPDDDNDGINDSPDNCQYVANPGQENNDLDAMGDACDDDDDNDGVLDVNDNCPFTDNVDQLNNDGDEYGDACDNDDDNDGVPDGSDNCPFDYNPGQEDSDNDNKGDACDCVCPDFCDLNRDGEMNPLDVVYLVTFVFRNQNAIIPIPDCPMENGDWDCSGGINPVDVVYSVNYVFKNIGQPCDPCAP